MELSICMTSDENRPPVRRVTQADREALQQSYRLAFARYGIVHGIPTSSFSVLLHWQCGTQVDWGEAAMLLAAAYHSASPDMYQEYTLRATTDSLLGTLCVVDRKDSAEAYGLPLAFVLCRTTEGTVYEVCQMDEDGILYATERCATCSQRYLSYVFWAKQHVSTCMALYHIRLMLKESWRYDKHFVQTLKERFAFDAWPMFITPVKDG